jgi:hypothetical protein
LEKKKGRKAAKKRLLSDIMRRREEQIPAVPPHHPPTLYPYMDKFVELLDSKHRILTWNAMAINANLASVYVDRKFDAAFDQYLAFWAASTW